jgi:hypothetical protein
MQVGGATFGVVIAMVAIYYGVYMIQSAGCLPETWSRWQKKDGTATQEEQSSPKQNGKNQYTF